MSKYDIRRDFECQNRILNVKTKNVKRITKNEKRITKNEKRKTNQLHIADVKMDILVTITSGEYFQG